MTREELENKIAVLLGGRATERLVFGHLSTGAADDLAKETDIARGMAARYGMDDELGYVSYDSDRPGFLGRDTQSYLERRYSEATAEKLDNAVRRVIDAQFDKATEILKANRDILDQSASELLSRETLDQDALQAIAARLGRAHRQTEAVRAGRRAVGRAPWRDPPRRCRRRW